MDDELAVMASQNSKKRVLPTDGSQFRACHEPSGIASALTKSASEVTLPRPK